jgi:dolichol-phosphate mannosyltransferase
MPVTETDRDRPVLSAVVPVNNEEELVANLLSSVAEALAPLGLPFEICIVDDGSTDGSWAALEAQAGLHPGSCEP